MKTLDGREHNNIDGDTRGRTERELYADSFKGLEKKPLEEERLRVIGLIAQTESIPTTKISPTDKEEILSRLWDTRRSIEAKLKLV